MDKISKLLSKISAKDKEMIACSLEKLLEGSFSGLDVLKLKGSVDIFRVRVGKYRVIYQKALVEIRILEISKRDDNTYRGY